ncbi:MAG: hypothetical protein R2873_36440 [Caldilineaceae bacterium]
MLDFQAVRAGKDDDWGFDARSNAGRSARALTNEMVDTMLGLASPMLRTRMIFTPSDPGAGRSLRSGRRRAQHLVDVGACDRTHHGFGRRIGVPGGGDGA